MEELPEINLDWLLSGKGEMFRNINYIEGDHDKQQVVDKLDIVGDNVGTINSKNSGGYNFHFEAGEAQGDIKIISDYLDEHGEGMSSDSAQRALNNLRNENTALKNIVQIQENMIIALKETIQLKESLLSVKYEDLKK